MAERRPRATNPHPVGDRFADGTVSTGGPSGSGDAGGYGGGRGGEGG
eukprot:CAMPEP_0113588140 /NCGR_PEP_ID=MMETSP0015_2-20120614/35334_1 /TAXON_ID=2838 /ORGANISM="Odontella" /LENGTH=46 /DNA_ID=CAMNT_0000493949 /DNA_START=206 /DNA_END=342 /DNA_ORIENTATION=- /assembly_acc=CAM_ASM_000160